jgi:hypothetical protein
MRREKGKSSQAQMKKIPFHTKNGLYHSQIAEKVNLRYLIESFLLRDSMKPMILY